MAQPKSRCIREAQSPWTLPALKEHFDALREDDKVAVAAALVAAEKAVAAALAAAEKATVVEAAANEKYRATQNEWRGALTDRERAEAAQLERYAQQITVDTAMESLRKAFDAALSAQDEKHGNAQGVLAERIGRAETTIANLQGRAVVYAGLGVAAGGLVVGFITKILGG